MNESSLKAFLYQVQPFEHQIKHVLKQINPFKNQIHPSESITLRPSSLVIVINVIFPYNG